MIYANLLIFQMEDFEDLQRQIKNQLQIIAELRQENHVCNNLFRFIFMNFTKSLIFVKQRILW